MVVSDLEGKCGVVIGTMKQRLTMIADSGNVGPLNGGLGDQGIDYVSVVLRELSVEPADVVDVL